MQSTKCLLVLFAVGLLPQHSSAADHYGPHQCVSIDRSQAGSCVFKTECKGVDLSQFEFAFICGAADGSSRKHSFGLGGFDEEEDYDTEVKCASCLAPLEEKRKADTMAKKKELPKAPQTLVAGATKTQQGPAKEEIFQVVKYGPSKCVSTYPSKGGTCILKTDCEKKALDGYAVGLVCADAQGEMVRHMFGTDAFHHKETFDTLIPCTQCLSLDNFDSGKDTEEAVLKDEVDTLKADFNGLNARVTKLEQAEEKQEDEKKAPAEDAKKAVAEEPKAEEKAFLRASSAKRRQHAVVPHAAKKSTHRRAKAHHKEAEEEDEDNDDEEEEGDEQEDGDDEEEE